MNLSGEYRFQLGNAVLGMRLRRATTLETRFQLFLMEQQIRIFQRWLLRILGWELPSSK
jgi:hypothetical protein